MTSGTTSALPLARDEEEQVIQVERLRKVFEHVEAHPDEWNQRYWGVRTPCGTSFCFAGRAVEMFGDHTSVWHSSTCQTGTDVFDYLTSPDGGVTYVDVAAQRLLGLSDDDCEVLFHPSNTLDDLRALVDYLTGVTSTLAGSNVSPHLYNYAALWRSGLKEVSYE